MWNWVGTVFTQNVILFLALVVNVVTLVFLIKYVRATKGIEEAANKQTEVSQGLLRAANVQGEASRELMAAANAQAAASEKLARWQPEQWRRDSRGQEWRELIGTLTQCFPKIELAKAVAPNAFVPATAQWNARQEEGRRALLEAWGVINDRLFIRDVLERERVREDWKEIESMSDRAAPVGPGEAPAIASPAGVTDLQQKWLVLHRKLVKAAQADLGIATGGSDTAHG